MKAKIYFKDSEKISSVTIDNLTSIKAVSISRSGNKMERPRYNEKNFHAFTPFENESYAFEGSQNTISVNGAEILYVEFVND